MTRKIKTIRRHKTMIGNWRITCLHFRSVCLFNFGSDRTSRPPRRSWLLSVLRFICHACDTSLYCILRLTLTWYQIYTKKLNTWDMNDQHLLTLKIRGGWRFFNKNLFKFLVLYSKHVFQTQCYILKLLNRYYKWHLIFILLYVHT